MNNELRAKDTMRRIPKGFQQTVLYLDYDGVLHHENVLWHPRRGAYAGPPGFELFEHAPLLAALLEPYPEILVVLSTSWVRRYGCYGSAKRLPDSLRRRVIGATFHSKMNEHSFVVTPRGQQVVEDVMRRKPRDWIALDDTDQGWPDKLRDHVLITDEKVGIGAPWAATDIQARLRALARA